MPKKRPLAGSKAKRPQARKRKRKSAPTKVVATARKTAEPAARPFALLVVVLLVTVAAGAMIRVGQAATFQGPTNAPPQGNIPVTVWNRVSTGTKQTNAAIDIDGGGPPAADTTVGSSPIGIQVGSTTLNMGSVDVGQNLFYGVTDFAKMNASDNLMLLQTYSGGIYTNRFTINKVGNAVLAGSFSSSGSISSSVGTVSGMYGVWAGALGIDFGVATTGQNVIYGGAMYGGMHPTGDFLIRLQTGVGAVPTDRMLLNRDGDLTVSGTAMLGSNTRVIGVGQNLVYGNVDTASTGSLLLLQNESVDRFRVDAAGNTTASGNLNANACFGPTFQGRTTLTYSGNLNGFATPSYVEANALCVSGYGPGAHVCSTAEILNSVKCSTGASPIRTQALNSDAWIQGGPPGFTAPANDCQGWTSANGGHLGRIWRFNTSSPASQVGMGFLSTCNQSVPFACCR